MWLRKRTLHFGTYFNEIFLSCRVPTFRGQKVIKHGGHHGISFLAHLSHRLMVSYCDRWMFVVRRASSVANNCFKRLLLLKNWLDFDQTCNCSMFCCKLLYVHSSIAIILMGKRELIALLNLSSWCLVMVERLFLAVPRGCLQFVIVVFPDHTHLLFLVGMILI